jgi:hypothetical protein
MEIVYTSHAVSRMLSRNISTEDVEAVIKDPDGKIIQTRDKFILFKKLRKRTDNDIAVVVVTQSPERCEVLTTMNNFVEKK